VSRWGRGFNSAILAESRIDWCNFLISSAWRGEAGMGGILERICKIFLVFERVVEMVAIPE
jgi:hypothetical protein